MPLVCNDVNYSIFVHYSFWTFQGVKDWPAGKIRLELYRAMRMCKLEGEHQPTWDLAHAISLGKIHGLSYSLHKRGAKLDDPLLERLGETEDQIKTHQDLLRSYPDDFAMRLSLDGLYAHRHELETMISAGGGVDG